MSSEAKPIPPTPAKGQQSLYPNPNAEGQPQPPTYDETMSPQPRAMPFQPLPPVGSSTPITQQLQVPVVQRKLISTL